MQRRSRTLRPRHVLAAAAALLCGAGAQAVEPAQWELATIAWAPQSTLTTPSLGIAPGGRNLQVAFALMGGSQGIGQVGWHGGVYLQDIGGRLRRVAAHGDPTPGQPGQVLCFDRGRCGSTSALRVSLDGGALAFIAPSILVSDGSTGLNGIYLADPAAAIRRIADTSMMIPGDVAQRRFSAFGSLGLALDRGRVAFNGWAGGSGNVVDAVYNGLYVGDGTTLGVVADAATRLPDSFVFDPRPGNAFGGNVAMRTTINGDTVVALDASLVYQPTGVGNIRSVLNWSSRTGWSFLARSGVDFPLNQTSFFLGSLDASGTAAFRADVSGARVADSGIWQGPPLRSAATAQTPTGGAPLGGFGFDPATDVAPRGIGQQPTTRWLAFIANNEVWLRTDNLRDGSTALERVADKAGLLAMAASAGLCWPPASDVSLDALDLQGEATRDGAVAFRVGVSGGCGTLDLIVLARRTTPTLLVQADADTQVRADLAVRQNDNHGLQDTLQVGTGREPFGTADRMRGLLHFDVSALPRLAITDAKLRASVHSYDNGSPAAVYQVDVRSSRTSWHLNGGEGNGYEGARPAGAAANLTGTDAAYGVAWAGVGTNPDPAAANNSTQPALTDIAEATQAIKQSGAGPGTRIEWGITGLTRDWLAGAQNNGIALTDATTDGSFRGVRFGSREGERYRLPGWVEGPRLALRWSVGSLAGDFTGDGCIDRNDLKLLTAITSGKAQPGPDLAPGLDLNADGRVDIADARKLVTLFSHPGGAACPAQPTLWSQP